MERCRLIAEEHDIDLVVHADAGCEVWGEAELVTTAVRNLVGNAIAYSEDSTRVGVSVRRPAENRVDIAVTDQGAGIAVEEQERIFERFYRVDSARSRATGGTGLGLAIVKHVVDNHGGQVSVWSEVGRGSTFTISLPTVARSQASGEPPSTVAGLPVSPAAARTRTPRAPEPVEASEPPNTPLTPLTPLRGHR